MFSEMKENFIFDDSAEAIVNIPVNELILSLQLRTLSSTQVLRAYIAKALIVHDNFNCITEFVPFASVSFFYLLYEILSLSISSVVGYSSRIG